MKKYWLIIRNTWDEYAAYRLNFIMWRVRMVIRFLITYFLWSTIYSGNKPFFGYTREMMLVYVLMVYLVSNFVFATRTQDLGGDINEGKITNYLLKPISYFKTIAFRDLGDKLINLLFSIGELFILFILLRPPVFIQTNIALLILFALTICIAIGLFFCISLLLSFIGFWTVEVWATRFIFFILLEYLSGTFFPVDILPKALFSFLMLTPFPYLFYFPVTIFLGRISSAQITTGVLVSILWLCGLLVSVQYVWRKGLKVYSAEGR